MLPLRAEPRNGHRRLRRRREAPGRTGTTPFLGSSRRAGRNGRSRGCLPEWRTSTWRRRSRRPHDLCVHGRLSTPGAVVTRWNASRPHPRESSVPADQFPLKTVGPMSKPGVPVGPSRTMAPKTSQHVPRHSSTELRRATTWYPLYASIRLRGSVVYARRMSSEHSMAFPKMTRLLADLAGGHAGSWR